MDRIDDLLKKIAERARKKGQEGSPLPSRKSVKIGEHPQKDETQRASTGLDDIKLLDPEEKKITDADIAVLVALPSPELSQVLNAFASQWAKEGREGVIFNVAQVKIDSKEATVVAAVQNDMGMVPTAILATKTIRAWRPKLVAMAGICAGVKGKVNIGDIVVGKQVFDYGSGKVQDGRLFPDYQPVTMDEGLCSYAIDLANNKQVLSVIRDAWPLSAGKPHTELRAHIGALASGAAVVADDTIVEGIQQHKRSLLAIDMEAYGLARAAAHAISPPVVHLVVKGVQDYADAAKSDEFREYAAFVSARFLYRFLDSYWAAILDRNRQLTSDWSVRV